MKSYCTRMMIVAVIFMLGLSHAGYAASDIGFKGIGLRLGYVDPEGPWNGTAEFGLLGDFGTFARQLHWDGALTYWRSDQDYEYPPWGRYAWTISDFAIRSGVKYHFVTGPWEPYIGGGLGIHFFTWDNKWHDYDRSMSESKVGLYFVGGIEHRFSRQWKGSAELQLDFADWDQTHVQLNAVYMLGK